MIITSFKAEIMDRTSIRTFRQCVASEVPWKLTLEGGAEVEWDTTGELEDG